MNVDRKTYEDFPLAKWKQQTKQDRWRLHYHLMPPTGWLNDPNGLCQMQDTYHIYYQYSPNDVDGKTKLWGHYSTKDFLHFIEHEPVLYEDDRRDAHGVYSGSAFVQGNKIHYFYTGNYKHAGCFNYINEGREHNTMHVVSEDGTAMSAKEQVLSNLEYPDDMSCHVRDPKVFEQDGCYYMVLGARTTAGKGCVLVYRSENLTQWDYAFRIEKENFGYMWECPDLFELDGQWFLLLCPQGLAQQGIAYENVYQCGYFPLTIDFASGSYALGAFQELDHGFDIYAPQTFADEHNRRILIPWMGLPDIDYTNPTSAHHWQHALGMPRELHARAGKLYQQPLSEMKQLRKEAFTCAMQDFTKAGKQGLCFEMKLDFAKDADFTMVLRQDITLTYRVNDHIFTLAMKEGGYGRTKRHVQLQQLSSLHIFSDTSSIELFLNDGEETMTSRNYAQKETIDLVQAANGQITYYDLGSYDIMEEER